MVECFSLLNRTQACMFSQQSGDRFRRANLCMKKFVSRTHPCVQFSCQKEWNWSWPCLWTVSSLYTSLTFLYTSLTFLLCNVMVLTIPHPFVPAVFKHRVWRGRNNHSRTYNAENCLCASTASWRGSCWQPLLHQSKTDSKPYIFFVLRLSLFLGR